MRAACFRIASAADSTKRVSRFGRSRLHNNSNNLGLLDHSRKGVGRMETRNVALMSSQISVSRSSNLRSADKLIGPRVLATDSPAIGSQRLSMFTRIARPPSASGGARRCFLNPARRFPRVLKANLMPFSSGIESSAKLDVRLAANTSDDGDVRSDRNYFRLGFGFFDIIDCPEPATS